MDGGSMDVIGGDVKGFHFGPELSCAELSGVGIAMATSGGVTMASTGVSVGVTSVNLRNGYVSGVSCCSEWSLVAEGGVGTLSIRWGRGG